MTTEHAPMAHDHAELDKHIRIYIGVFVALMVLTVITVAISYLHLSVPVAVAHGVGAGHGGFFGDAQELERKVRFHELWRH